MTPSSILTHAAKLLSQGWVQRQPAATATGAFCQPNNLLATAWCLVGAMERAALDLGGRDNLYGVAHNAAMLALTRAVNQSISTFNDRPQTSLTTVLAAITKAQQAFTTGS